MPPHKMQVLHTQREHAKYGQLLHKSLSQSHNTHCNQSRDFSTGKEILKRHGGVQHLRLLLANLPSHDMLQCSAQRGQGTPQTTV